MNNFLKVILVYLSLYQCDVVLSRKIIKKVWIIKEFEHGFLHHFSPISIIKEAVTPLGTLSVEHSVEKRDLQQHIRKVREAEDIEFPNVENEGEPDTVIETKKKIVSGNNLLTDIILTRVEFHRGKPVDAIKLQSISFPGETNQEDVSSISTGISSDLDTQASSKESIKESEPSQENETEEVKSEKLTEQKTDIEASSKESINESEPSKINETEEVKSEKLTEPKADVEVISTEEEKEKAEEEKKEETSDADAEVSKFELSEVSDEKESSEVAQVSEAVIENREKETEAIHENIETIPAKPEPLVEVPKPVETPTVSVSPLPQPIYIPLYTDVKTPVPIPVQHVVSEVVVSETPVVVVTEKEVVIAPPPPPPVQTETTVIQTENTQGLFTRGSRFMLNIGSRILRKLLRLVSRVQSRLPPPPAET